MLAVVVLGGFLAAVVAMLGAAVIDRHRAEAAADLAALAAAGALNSSLGLSAGGLQAGGAGACGAAGRVARLNQARLTQCRVLGDGSVIVAVAVGPHGRRPLGPAVARSRAGPARES